MSKPARTTTTGTKVQPPPVPYRDEDGRVSGARRAIKVDYSAYDGLMQLGSEAFSAPLPPAKSERPHALPRLHLGWYLISAGIGFFIGAVALALFFKPSLAPAPRVALASAPIYSGSWTLIDRGHAQPMREVLEPITAAAAIAVDDVPAASAPEIAAPLPAAEPAEQSAAAPAPEVAARAETGDPPAAAPSATVPRQTHASSRHARHGAPVAQLSRAQVIAAMQRVEPEVSACFRGTRGSATADVTIVGRTGRVTTAHIDGQNGMIGSCIARAVRNASFPLFKSETLTIRYPFVH